VKEIGVAIRFVTSFDTNVGSFNATVICEGYLERLFWKLDWIQEKKTLRLDGSACRSSSPYSPHP
jgi:hypothetical protein